MDPVTVVLSALAEGAALALKDTVGGAIKDAYDGLKSLVRRKFSGNQQAEVALAGHDVKPEVWKEPLKDALQETHAADDPEVLAAAERLLNALRAPTELGSVQAHFHAPVNGSVVGHGNEVTQNFNR